VYVQMYLLLAKSFYISISIFLFKKFSFLWKI